MAAQGGIAIGKSHAEGGIPLTVNSTGQHIEVEGDEYVFKAGSLDDKNVLEIEATPWQIIQQIAKTNGSSLGKLKEVDGGEFVICKKVMYDTNVIKVKGTAQHIINELQLDKGCKIGSDKTFKTGGAIKEFCILEYLGLI